MSNSIIDVLSLLAPDLRARARQEAFYTLQWLPIGANGANVKATVTTQSDSDFVALRMRAYVTDTATPPVEIATPQATLTLANGANLLMPDQNGIHIGTFACSAAARRGLDFAYPVYIARSTTLTGFLTNLTGTAMNVRIFLEGFQLMNYNG